MASFFSYGLGALLNYFVLEHNLGLFGVGASSFILRVFLTVWLLILLSKIKIKLQFASFFDFDFSVLKKLLYIGGASAGEGVAWTVQYTIALGMINVLGSVQITVQVIFFQISMFVGLIGQSLSISNEIIVGKLFGANRKNLAYRHCLNALCIALGVTFIITVCAFFLRDPLMRSLKLEDAYMMTMAPLFALGIFEIGRVGNILIINALRACGDATFSLVLGIFGIYCIALPLGYVLMYKFNLGVFGMWIGFYADEMFRMIINIMRWRSRVWMSKKLV